MPTSSFINTDEKPKIFQSRQRAKSCIPSAEATSWAAGNHELSQHIFFWASLCRSVVAWLVCTMESPWKASKTTCVPSPVIMISSISGVAWAAELLKDPQVILMCGRVWEALLWAQGGVWPSYSKCGLCTRSTWKLVRNADSQAPPQTSCTRVHILTRSPSWFPCTLKYENHLFKAQTKFFSV